MTKIELKTFRRALEAKQSETGTGRASREALAIDSSPDELDRIQNAGEREYAMRHLERNSRLQGEVRDALLRMDDGLFGICGNCEQEINPKRLAALPWAPLCIVCQEAADLAAKSPEGDLVETLELAA